MTISSFCRDELMTDGPLTVLELAVRLVRAGGTTSQNPESSVKQAISAAEVLLPDGRWATPLWLLEGRILTTRGLEDSEDDDLHLLRRAAAGAGVPLATGGRLTRHSYGGWRLPARWPEVDLGPFEVLGLRVVQGALHAEVVALSPDVRARGEVLERELGNLLPDPRSSWQHSVVDILDAKLWARMVLDPAFLTEAVPPFRECLTDLIPVRVPAVMRTELELPRDLMLLAQDAAADAGKSTEAWLSDLVGSSLLRQRPDAAVWGVGAAVLPFRGRA